MGAPFNRICGKLEEALEDVLLAEKDVNLSGVQIVTGFTGDVKLTIPRVHILCPRAEPELIEEVIFTGNWWVDFEITVFTSYKDDSRATQGKRAAELFDVILQPDLPVKMNNLGEVEDFHAYGTGQNQTEPGLIPLEIIRDTIDSAYFEQLSGKQYCRPRT